MLKIEKSFHSLQAKNEQKLNEFLDFMDHFLCKSCWNDKKNVEKPFHHHGAFLYLLSFEPKITKDSFEKWISDTEHGLLHGLMTAFFCYSLSENKSKLFEDVATDGSKWSVERNKGVIKYHSQKELKTERLFYSCLFHDYVKTCFGMEPHDQLLSNFFPKCLDETYTHANPKEESDLVISDRLELARYKDYKSWCDMDVLNKHINSYGKEEFEHFHNHIRPLLEETVKYREDIWISHLVENIDKNIQYYPEHHWIAHDSFMERQADAEDYYSVSMDYLPFDNCHTHVYQFYIKDKKQKLVGLLPRSKLLEAGNGLVASPDSTWGRDHPFVKKKQNIPIESWVFLYDEPNDLDLIDLTNIKLLKIDVFNKFWAIKQNLIARIHGLKVE